MRSSWMGKLCLFTTSVVIGSNLVVTSARGETSGLGISDDAVVSFAWNANTEANLAGYRLYVGTLPGVYAGYVEVGLTTSYQVSDLVRGTTYFFALTAYNTAGLESDFTPELTRTIPLVIGSAPNGIDAGGIAGSMTNLVAESETNGLTGRVLPADEPAPPEIARVADQWIVKSWVSLPIRLSILDPDTPPEALEVVATSSNPALLPEGGLLLSVYEGNWRLRLDPVNGRTGTSTITIYASDGTGIASMSFDVTVDDPWMMLLGDWLSL